ncbi:MAG: flagellar type III secretion system pore protein FliP [Planctomycetales bacterium]|nr:flagellar type III secretion system pore protein FliP [Planctomycetales bacterium]
MADHAAASAASDRPGCLLRGGLLALLLGLACLAAPATALAQTAPPASASDALQQAAGQDWFSPQAFQGTLKTLLMLGVLSLAPAVLLMTTSFVRIVIVLGLLRQALGIQQLPSTQLITSLAMFMSLVIMTPVWKQVYDEGVMPYTQQEKTLPQAWQDGVQPVRRFMSLQIEATGNQEDIWLFLRYLPATQAPQTYDDVPLAALLPAFMLSELKTAFLIGFQIFIPFLILDMVVASVTVTMGMVMLPPAMISLPFKLLLFVLVDGWHLVVGMLLESFAPFL